MTIKATRGEDVSTEFTATNFTGADESISHVTITLSNPGLFSDLQLAAGDQAGDGNPSPPETTNTFTFSPPISLPSMGTLTFTVIGSVAQKQAKIAPSILSGGVAYAAIGAGTGKSSRPMAPWTGLLMIAGLVTLASAVRSRRWILAGGALILIITVAGCGGGSSGGGTPSSPSSRMEITQASTLGPQSGLPLTIARVTTTR